MDIKHLTDAYAVSPQIAPEDMALLKEAGFTTVINNRPDAEIPPALHADVMAQAAEQAGLEYVVNPIIPGGLTEQSVETQKATINKDGAKVFAYCASGNRSAIVWSLIMAPVLGTDSVLSATSAAGYDHSAFRPHFDAMIAQA